MNDTFMKEKPILPLLTSMALPMVVSMLVNSLYNIVDSLFVAQINEKAMTALSLVYPLQNLMNAIAIGFGIGINAVIAFHLGAGEKERVKKIYRLTLYMTGSIMILGTILCLLASGQLIGFFTTNSETIRIGQTALRVISMGFVISAVSVTTSGALEGLGKGKESFQISLCRYLITIVPAAWILCRIGGAEWVWHAFWISETITALIAWRIYHKSVKMN